MSLVQWQVVPFVGGEDLLIALSPSGKEIRALFLH